MNKGFRIFGMGVIFGLLIIGIVFATGQTFGQRCVDEYGLQKDSRAWCECVEGMSNGTY